MKSINNLLRIDNVYMAVKYASIKIPRGLADKVVEVAIQRIGTYRTVSEFVIESTRRHLEDIDVKEVKPS